MSIGMVLFNTIENGVQGDFQIVTVIDQTARKKRQSKIWKSFKENTETSMVLFATIFGLHAAARFVSWFKWKEKLIKYESNYLTNLAFCFFDNRMYTFHPWFQMWSPISLKLSSSIWFIEVSWGLRMQHFLKFGSIYSAISLHQYANPYHFSDKFLTHLIHFKSWIFLFYTLL